MFSKIYDLKLKHQTLVAITATTSISYVFYQD